MQHRRPHLLPASGTAARRITRDAMSGARSATTSLGACMRMTVAAADLHRCCFRCHRCCYFRCHRCCYSRCCCLGYCCLRRSCVSAAECLCRMRCIASCAIRRYAYIYRHHVRRDRAWTELEHAEVLQQPIIRQNAPRALGSAPPPNAHIATAEP